MNYRTLGTTGLKVSELGIGCEGMVEENYAMAGKLIDIAERHGINYFDFFSPDPQLRDAVGCALEGRRDRFLIQGHICAAWENGQYLRTRDLAKTKAAFEDLLARLRTDHIDVGMIHYCDSLSDWKMIVKSGILDYAKELKAQGKIRHIGLSSHNPQVAKQAIEEGAIEVLMFSVNPCYDLQPADEDVEKLWADEAYENVLTNMDPERQELYELCAERGVGITVMKAFGGGDLLDASLSPAGAALTVNQCIQYALDRPAVTSIMCGAHTEEQFEVCAAYENAAEEEKDYAAVFASFPKIKWSGHCMYCNHCLPCPAQIDIAEVTKYLNLAKAQESVPETVQSHYELLAHHAGECLQCGGCETRCPFGVAVRENMNEAKAVFGI